MKPLQSVVRCYHCSSDLHLSHDCIYAPEGPLAPQFNNQTAEYRPQYVAISMRAMGISADSAPANLC